MVSLANNFDSNDYWQEKPLYHHNQMTESIGMEHTHLISVCVFCLLCATHIHCSEYSSRAIRSKIKSKGEHSVRNHETWEKLYRENDGGGGKSIWDHSDLVPEKFFPGFRNEKKVARSVRRFSRVARAVLLRSESKTFRNTDSNGIPSVLSEPEGKEYPRDKRNAKSEATIFAEQVYLEKLFKMYMNSDNKIDLKGFKSLLKNLHLPDSLYIGNKTIIQEESENVESQKFQGETSVENQKRNSNGVVLGNDIHAECLSAEALLSNEAADPSFREPHSVDSNENSISTNQRKSERNLTKEEFAQVLPLLLFNVLNPWRCRDFDDHADQHVGDDRLSVWLYATVSVIIISLCGLFGVLVVPVMGNAFYQQLLQFLVALAVGTLCGDALLHLLPHAMIPHHDDDEIHAEVGDHGHTVTMWKGLAVMLGIVFFFFTEKVLNLGSEWRKRRQRNRKVQGHSHVQILNGNDENNSVGEKLCKHKYSSYPYCYPDIKSNKDGHEHSRSIAGYKEDKGGCMGSSIKWPEEPRDSGESQRLTHLPERDGKTDVDEKGDDGDVEDSENKEKKFDLNEIECDKKDGEYTVIIREHQTTHHGHSHAHGHVHSAPESLSSVAWMVVLGDGLHNFTDGMAIGAAFSNNIAGGCSTAVAVFCHELPHELGDFAVLLKAGMSAKQAVFYNLMSSILCFIGMCLGIFVGDNPESSSWIFAVSAGMFLYIGLVDMFPELTTSHSAIESSLCQCSLQGLGLISGVSIMLVIAYYEDHLLNLFK